MSKIRHYQLAKKGGGIIKRLFVPCSFFLTLFFIIFYALSILPLSEPNKLLLLLLTVAASCVFAFAKTTIVPSYACGKLAFAFFPLLFYATFAAVGNHLFLQPARFTLWTHWLYFFAFAVWVFPMLMSMLYLLEKGAQSLPVAPPSTKAEQRKGFIATFIACTAIGAIYLLAYNPAIMSFDSFHQWLQARGDIELTNAHPFMHTLFIRGLIQIFPHPAFVVFPQILFFAFVCASYISFLLSLGMPKKLLFIFICFFALIPTNGIHLVTLWKDVPYSTTILWLTLVLAKLCFNKTYGKTLSDLIELTIPLILVCVLRHNGLIVYAVMAIALFVFAQRRKIWGLVVPVIISLTVLVLGVYPLQKSMQVVPIGPAFKYQALANDLAGIYFSQLPPPNELKFIFDGQVSNEESGVKYSPYYNYLDYSKKTSSIKVFDFLRLYIETSLQYPGAMINNFLCRTDLYWDVTTGKDGDLPWQNSSSLK